jgi:hypothetical protein
MSATEAVRLVLRHFAKLRPVATLAFDQHVGALTPRVILVGIDTAVRSHVEVREPSAAGHPLRR